MTVRIALLFEFPTLSGGEAAALEIVRRLDRRRHEPIALAPPEGALADALRAADVPLHPLVLKGRAPPKAAADIARIAVAAGAQVLHANSLALARHSGPAGEIAGVPNLAHVRDIQRLSHAKLHDIALNQRIVVVSHAVERSLVEQGIPADRLVLIPDGIDVARAASGRPGKLRAELGLAAGTPLVGCVGQIALRKAQDVFVEAAALVPEAHFAIVGSRFSRKDESRLFEEALHRRVARLGIGARVHFLGQRNDVPDLLADFDVFAHPANEEPQSIAVLEAMAAGRPVVATNVGGTPEVIEDGVSGLLVPPKDPRALADAVRRILHDTALGARLAAAGRERAASAYRPEQATARVAAIYDELAHQIASRVAMLAIGHGGSVRLTPDIDEVGVDLYLGSAPTDPMIAFLSRLGIRGILNVAAESESHPELATSGIEEIRVPLEDCVPLAGADVERALRALRELVGRGKTLVHCVAGASRSPAIVALYWIATGEANLMSEALRKLRTSRSTVNVSPALISMEALMVAKRLRSEWNDRHR